MAALYGIPLPLVGNGLSVPLLQLISPRVIAERCSLDSQWHHNRPRNVSIYAVYYNLLLNSGGDSHDVFMTYSACFYNCVSSGNKFM